MLNPTSRPIKLIGGKWKITILHKLHESPLRFGELKKALSPITQQMLTKQLRELESAHLVNREVFDVIPPKVEYSLSTFGKSIIPVLDSLCKWSSTHEELLDAIIYIVADYIRTCGDRGENDDNELIMKYAIDLKLIKSEKHRLILWNLKYLLAGDLLS